MVPVFALANAGVPLVDISFTDLVHPVPLGVMACLFLGKFLGIMEVSGLAVPFKVADLPKWVGWRQLQGVSLLCSAAWALP